MRLPRRLARASRPAAAHAEHATQSTLQTRLPRLRACAGQLEGRARRALTPEKGLPPAQTLSHENSFSLPLFFSQAWPCPRPARPAALGECARLEGAWARGGAWREGASLEEAARAHRARVFFG